MSEINYVQLESAAFLTDLDFQMMDAEQRGVYCSIIFYLYCNNGSLELSGDDEITLLEGRTTVLASMSGCRKVGGEWNAVWAKIAHKFQITGNALTHKRVTEELEKVAAYRKAKSDAGKKGMKTRWGDNTAIPPVITKVSKVKVSKVKKREEKNTYMQFVKLTVGEHQKLLERFGEQGTSERIEALNEGIGSKGYKYKSHYFTILSWERRHEREQSGKSQQTGPSPASSQQGRPSGGPVGEFIR